MGPNWTPRFRHVSQIEVDQSGHSNCAQASIARALMEYDATTPARMANPEWALVRQVADSHSGQTIWNLINQLCIISRGYPDSPYNSPTSNTEFEAIFRVFGLPWTSYTTSNLTQAEIFFHVWNNPMVLCWVDGVALAPPSFPASYLQWWSGYDHLILSLPNGEFNDPLTVFSNVTGNAASVDVFYSPATVQAALGGCWVLPAPEPIMIRKWIIQVKCTLKLWPNHLGSPANKAVAYLLKGERVFPTGYSTPSWAEIKTSSGVKGFILKTSMALKLSESMSTHLPNTTLEHPPNTT